MFKLITENLETDMNIIYEKNFKNLQIAFYI